MIMSPSALDMVLESPYWTEHQALMTMGTNYIEMRGGDGGKFTGKAAQDSTWGSVASGTNSLSVQRLTPHNSWILRQS